MNALRINIPVIVYKKREYWIAYTPVLKTFGYSNENKDKALDDFDKAIDTFFHVQKELGTLESTLTKLGWKKTDHTREIPKYFNIPIEDIKQGAVKQDRNICIPA